MNHVGNGTGATFVVSAIDQSVVNAVNLILRLKEGQTSIWVCPNRLNTPAPGLPTYFGTSQMYIGYCYFGGISIWTSDSKGKSYSPVKLGISKPWWALGADTLMKVGNQWSGSPSALSGANAAYAFEYGSIPPHPIKGGNAAGGNEVFTDGSALWCKFDTMYRFNNYASAIGSLDSYWYQDSRDFDQTLVNALPGLK